MCVAALCALAVAVYWVVLWHPGSLPRMVVEGSGLTRTKIACEYGIIALLAGAAAGFRARHRRSKDAGDALLLRASAISILSELCFTLYVDVTDVFNLLGHLYKVVAYLYVFRAFVVQGLEEPFARLSRAEHELRAAALYARGLLEASLDPLVTISPEGRITDVNRATEVITGASREHLIGSHFADYFTNPARARAGYQKVLAEGFVRDYALTVRARAGETREVLYNATTYRDPAGELQGVFAAARDITERKRTEESLRRSEAILEQTQQVSRVGGWEYEVAAARLYWTREVFQIYELPPDRDPNLLRLIEFYADGHRQRLAAAFETALETGTGYDLELQLVTGAGRTVWVRAVATARVRDGRVEHLYGTIQDITAQRRSQEELRLYRANLEDLVKTRTAQIASYAEQLEATNRELESFSYSVSHDLRAPLRAIDGFSLALLEDYGGQLDAEGRDSLQRVRSASQRMGRMIDDILQLSHINRGELERIPVDVAALAREIFELLQAAEPGRDVRLAVQPGLRASADIRLLRQALQNLIGNAWKFTSRRGTAHIEIGCAPCEGGDVFFVRDNGAGFDKRYAGKLFTPFTRLHGLEEFPGTGVGLAIVQRVVNRHGGKVWAESEVERGATFYFTLA